MCSSSLPRSMMGSLPQLTCADCSAADPTWASLNRGVLICAECCSGHRSLGRHISQIRSMKRGAWHSSQLALIHTLYNNGANNIWEHLLLDPQGANKHLRKKPHARDPVYPTKAEFVRAKYANLSFALRPEGPLNVLDLNRQLWSCVRTAHVETTLRLLALGANPVYTDPERGTAPMHVAAKEGQALQVELLAIYGGDPSEPDHAGQTPAEVARAEKHLDLADRLTELQFETTDRLTMYLCGRKPDHRSGQDFVIPEMASGAGDSATGREARRRLRVLPPKSFEKLVQDVYDEVDRRETDASWLSSIGPAEAAHVNDRYIVPFLPVNPEFTATRNQSRQKLAKFNAREFASLIIDVLSEAKRRHLGETGDTPRHKSAESQELQETKKPSSASVELDDDIPVYDDVPSEEDVLSGAEERRERDSDGQLVTLDDYMDLREQLVSSEQKVIELTRSNTEIVRQLQYVQSMVERMMKENKTLQHQRPNGVPEVPFPVSNGDGSSSRGSRSASVGRHLSGSGSGGSRNHLKPESAGSCSSTPNSFQFGERPIGILDYGGPERGFPGNLEQRTVALTQEIHGLLGDAQSGRVHAFPSRAASVQGLIDSMVTLIPPRLRCPSMEQCLNQLVDACICLTVQCSKEVSGRQEQVACQVVQAAYGVAKAAKELMLLVQS